MKKIMIIVFVILININLFLNSAEQKEARKIFGKIVFCSERTSDGNLYIFLLENGEIKNLGIESDIAKISPNGKLVAAFAETKNNTNRELCIYDLRKNKIIKKHPIKNEQGYDIEWTRDGKYIIYAVKEETGKKNENGRNIYNTYLMRINIKTGKEEILREYRDVLFFYNIKNINISLDNKRMVLTIGISGEFKDYENILKVYVMDIDGKNEKVVWLVGVPLGWFPDNKNILIHTNRAEDASKINRKHGRLYKLNVDTLEKEIIEETVEEVYTTEKLTRDGQYIYSCIYNPFMSFNLVAGDLKDRSSGTMITYPIKYEKYGMIFYSDDSSPDWWYE
ncbi:MAG: hypothetical protein LBF97_00355 [Elusimicrobiota bacterium]|jgi:hypothetical protein|nr:hypothetical protein [Elusimicrobiota bacterium]